MASEKVKILYSHGGKILLLPPNRLSYVGGQTKLLSFDRRYATLPLLLSRLPTSPPSYSIKYQLPGLDLGSLVSLVDHNDFLHMLYEYDCACSASDSTMSPRLRLFLFPIAMESPIVSVNPDYLFGLDELYSNVNSAGSDAFPVDEGGKIFEDLMSGNYHDDRGVNSKLPAEPVSAMEPKTISVAVPMQTTAGYSQTTMTQHVTEQIGNAYNPVLATPFVYYDRGRYQLVQLKAAAGDVGHQYNPPQVIGYNWAGSQRLYYVLPQQGYQVGIEVTDGGLGSEAKGVGLSPLPQTSAV